MLSFCSILRLSPHQFPVFSALAGQLGSLLQAMAVATTYRCSTRPSWLQAALSDIEQRVQSLAVNVPDGPESDSFAVRAENYYQKRPQLIALLHDLHHRYLYLADRYSQSLIRRHHRRASSVPSDLDAEDDPDLPDSASSDAESSLSFQPLPPQACSRDTSLAVAGADLDMIVAELVVAAVERGLLEAEGAEAERLLAESARKIDLQGSLVEVLEAERLVLLGENARLEFRARAAEQEARAVAAELVYIRRRAAELARVVVKLREDHRVCLLGRKIEDLQAQIYSLERRNRECVEATSLREKEKGEVRAEADRLRGEPPVEGGSGGGPGQAWVGSELVGAGAEVRVDPVSVCAAREGSQGSERVLLLLSPFRANFAFVVCSSIVV
ncbi:KIP1-like protein [Musa troglodytarum]|uniref:KIP1-like protein n=1 Tax=Musa troglodytarum TaxID=320322 RepID=A0A9E7G0D2_9LILI|nr:KIP1-like protein [Musa troglodytarum]